VTDRAIRVERCENILALCIDIYTAVGVLAEREPDDDDLDELLYILKATAAIKALALAERNGVPV